jgi:hypothetical protein
MALMIAFALAYKASALALALMIAFALVYKASALA